MSSFRSKLISLSREINSTRRQAGYLATISPAPLDLIWLVAVDLFGSTAASLANDEPQDGAVVIDMGSGDGRWLYMFALYLQIHGGSYCGIGVEMDDGRLKLSRNGSIVPQIQALLADQCSAAAHQSLRLPTIEWIQADFMHINSGMAHIILVYLSREGNEALMAKFVKECSPGTIIIATGFKMVRCPVNWMLEKVLTSSSTGLAAYKYRIIADSEVDAVTASCTASREGV